MNILMGIGNPLRGDDGVGPYIARHFRKEGWISLDCGTAPENFTGILRKEQPEIVVVVDAAEMGLLPGAFRRIIPSRLADISFSTHGPSLVQLLTFLQPMVSQIVVIGVQPENIHDCRILSSSVRDAAKLLLMLLQTGEFLHIQGM